MTHGSAIPPVRRKDSDVEYVWRADRTWADEFVDALNDLVASARMWRTWTTLGWRDYRHQTGRNFLGPLWSVVGLGVTVGALGYVYGALLSFGPRRGYPFIAAGLIAWFFAAACIGGGPSVFLNAAGLIKERTLPISFSAYQYTYRLFVEFCFKFSVFALIALITLFFPGPNLVFLLPSLVIYFVNGLWVTLLMGVAGARYRDIGEIVGPLMLIVFLATPILWPPEMLHSDQFIAQLNPFTHFIGIIREPLLGAMPSAASFGIVLAITSAGWTATVLVFARTKDRVVFWL